MYKWRTIARLSDGSELPLSTDVPEYDDARRRFKEICGRVRVEEPPEWIEGGWDGDPLVRTSAIIALRIDLETDYEDEADVAQQVAGDEAQQPRHRWRWGR